MNEAAIPVIAIDGPTASGKGTVAQRVAQTLGFHYLDSGALYRIVGLACLRSHVDFSDMAAVTAHAIAIAPRFVCGRVLLGDEDISKEIRTEEVGTAASLAAQIPSVRDALFELQRRERKQPGLVADGRDMGSVIFPDACLKVFLTASVETRARRRYKQLIEKGIDVKLDTLVSEMAERDRRDMQRMHAPLVPAEGAKILDSSCLTIQETVVKILHWYDQVSLGGAD
ncbi:(d)CMP kinase [Mesosutterella sp. OilRF-GAM-744-9]|uniref:Cytidylate kinase n=2 Tax=Mesosutterella porci TaxID=2915351 RepID=A0ABS9MSL6_9BURK|nr:(d)CMP kinase [Mesosutterella sp. oilRF-744-WT-GAM-9]